MIATAPPESCVAPIVYQPPRPARLLPLLLLSIALHVVLALGLAFVLSRHLGEQPVPLPELSIDVTLGEELQELIVAPSSPEPAPPPPSPLPPPEPAAEPPPANVEKPDFVEPLREPRPLPAQTQPKAAPQKPKPARPGAKVGPQPRDGVIGGTVARGKTNGTPGAANGGWRLPEPPYPMAARAAHITARGSARIITNAAGNVVSCETSGLPPPLDSNTRSFARGNWKGPPNSTHTVPVIYRLQ